jgi:hypothetical protein
MKGECLMVWRYWPLSETDYCEIRGDVMVSKKPVFKKSSISYDGMMKCRKLEEFNSEPDSSGEGDKKDV